MSYRTWIVSNGALGTATVTNGQLIDFEAAQLTPSPTREMPNLIDWLTTGAEDSPLGLFLLEAVGGTDVSLCCVQAEPVGRNVFPPGVRNTLRIAPKIQAVRETVQTAGYLDEQRLARFNELITSVEGRRRLGNDTESGSVDPAPLLGVELPPTLDIVRATALSYFYCGECFNERTDVGIIGLHAYSVGQIEAALRSSSGGSGPVVRNVLHHKERSKDKRRQRELIRCQIQEIIDQVRICCVTGRDNFELLLAWLGCEGEMTAVPPFLKENVEKLYSRVGAKHLANFQSEFQSLARDLIAKLKEMVVEYLTASAAAKQ